MKNKNGVIYARYSSQSQDAQTIDMQIKICREFAKKSGLKILDEYIDEARSGTNSNRPGFIRLKEDCKLGKFSYIIVYMSDRLYRNIKEILDFEYEIKEYNVTILYANENCYDDTPQSFLLKNLNYVLNDFYSRLYSKKIRDGLLRCAKLYQSRGSNVPFGYKTINKKIVIDKSTSIYVKKIYSLFLEDRTFTEICDYLNSLNIKTKRKKTFKISSVKRILNNEMYIGTYTYKDEKTPDVIPRIIDKDIFYKVKEKLKESDKRRSKPKRQNYALTGKLFCKKCDTLMTSDSGTSKTNLVYRYYRCKNSFVCHQKPVKKELIEDKIYNAINTLLNDDMIDIVAKALEEKSKDTFDGTTLNLLIKSKEINTKNINNIIAAIAEADTSEVRSDLMNKLKTLKETSETIEEEIIKEKNNHIILKYNEIKFFLLNNSKKNTDTLINHIVNKIYYSNEKIYIVFNCGNSNKEISIDDLDAIINQQCSPGPPNAPPNEY